MPSLERIRELCIRLAKAEKADFDAIAVELENALDLYFRDRAQESFETEAYSVIVKLGCTTPSLT